MPETKFTSRSVRIAEDEAKWLSAAATKGGVSQNDLIRLGLHRLATHQPGTDIDQLGRCGRAMLGANRWRIAAAHAYLVDKKTWDDTHIVILDRERGLMVQLCAALPDP